MSLSNSWSEGDELLHDVNPDLELDTGAVFTRLNDVVRKQYFCFLEKLLKENYSAWCKDALNQIQLQKDVKACAELLEDKALKACMVVQIYRKTMIKIITSVRRSTEQCRLQHHLRTLIESRSTLKATEALSETKSTQTESYVAKNNKCIQTLGVVQYSDSDFTSPSLQWKIKKFQEKLNRDAASMVAATKPQSKLKVTLGRSKRKRRATGVSPETSPVSFTQSPSIHEQLSSPLVPTGIQQDSTQIKKCHDVKEINNVNDEVAMKLAQLFSEEKSEIDNIFGFDSNDEPDDPQINSILKEIESAKLPHEQNTTIECEEYLHEAPTTSSKPCSPSQIKHLKHDKHHHSSANQNRPADMRNSLWPCELYMQRRRLSEALSRLVEEDFRWSEIMKWKFLQLFGEDSEDEFASYSPTIELDEVLMCSCVKRISPWVVKHLMKPMKDGLIANRFLFKKLAKKLSRSIILENQYPDEKMIKTVVEDFFCIHQTVISLEDLEMPSTLYNENI